MKFIQKAALVTTLILSCSQMAYAFGSMSPVPPSKTPVQRAVETSAVPPVKQRLTLRLPLTMPQISAYRLSTTSGKRVTPSELIQLLTPRQGEDVAGRETRTTSLSKILTELVGAQLFDKEMRPLKSAVIGTMAPEQVTIVLDVSMFDEDVVDLPLASVNGETISVFELNEALGSVHMGADESKKVGKQSFGDIINRLVTIKLLVQEGKEIGIDRLPETKELLVGAENKKLREMLLTMQLQNISADDEEILQRYANKQTEWRLRFLQFTSRKDADAVVKALKKGTGFDALYSKSLKNKTAIGDPGDKPTPGEALQPEMLKVIAQTKVGEVTPVMENDGHYFLAKVLSRKSRPDDPAVMDEIRQEELKKARVKSYETYRGELIKKLATYDDALIDGLDLEAKEPGFISYRNDKRVLVTIQGEQPVTVADLIASFEKKFFHGVERMISEKKLNSAKREQLVEVIGSRVLLSEARLRGLDKTREFQVASRDTEEMTIFGMLIEKAIKPDVHVTQEELEAYYKEHSKEYTSVEQLTLELLPFKTESQAASAAEKLKRGLDIKWMKENGEGYVPVAKTEFADTTLQHVERSVLPDKLVKVLNGVQEGDIRLLSGSPHSFVVLVNALTPVSILPLERVAGDIRAKLGTAKLNEAVTSYTSKLKAESEITVYLDLEG